MSTGELETRRELEQIYTKKELSVKLVIYKNSLLDAKLSLSYAVWNTVLLLRWANLTKFTPFFI